MRSCFWSRHICLSSFNSTFFFFFFFRGTSFPIQGNGVGVMNSCRGQTMSPLWPPVCKWNSQQSTGQEVILVYSLGTRLCREHSGRFSSPSSLNGTMQPLFFLQPFFLQSGSICFHFSWQWNWGNPQRMSIPIIFCLLVGVCKQKKKGKEQQSRAERLTAALCLCCATWQIKLFRRHCFPSVELKAVSRRKAVVVTSPCQSSQPRFANGQFLLHIPKQHWLQNPLQTNAALMACMDLWRIIGRRV